MGKFFEFHQNNSGGSYDIDDKAGLGPNVWIEADDADHANYLAGRKGIYFDGCDSGTDCPCCGDRWYPAHGEGSTDPTIDPMFAFGWHHTVYVHHKDGTVERIKKAADEVAA